MKALWIILVMTLSITSVHAQSPADSAAVRNTALNYAEGWYEGNADRMALALHPALTKRIIGWSRDIKKNDNILNEMNYDQLIDRTRKGFGKRTLQDNQLKKVTILSMFHNSASVKLEMTEWIDYLHIGRWNGEWKIINVLWEMKPQE